MRLASAWCRLLVTVFIPAMVIGCSGGDGLPRQYVSGKVTLDGQPLEDGVIQFEPVNVEVAKTAVSGGATIKGGSYAIEREQGLIPGQYTVAIFSSSGEPAQDQNAPGKSTGVMKERIPARYNAQSTLDAEVKDGGGNTFNYDLKSK